MVELRKRTETGLSMEFPKQLRFNTPYFRILAVIMFIALPIITFHFGLRIGTEQSEKINNKNLANYITVSNLGPTQVIHAEPSSTTMPIISPTDEIAYWDTFSAMGISFKYPNTYYIGEVFEEFGTVSLYSPKNKNLPDTLHVTGGDLKVTFHIGESNEYTSIEDILKSHTTNQNSLESYGISRQKILHVNNLPVYYEKGFQHEKYVFLHKNKTITIMKYPSDSTRESEFISILDSLKFKGV